MKNINNILQYNFSIKETEALLNCGIANGCGGKGGINFDEIISQHIEEIAGFNYLYYEQLFIDIKKICIEHDFDFRIQVGFYRANYRMGKKIYKLLKKWAGKKEAFGIGFLVFALLSKYGEEYYNNSIKK